MMLLQWYYCNSFLDTILQCEVEKRDIEIEDLKKKHSAEIKMRMKIEKKRDNLAKQLVSINFMITGMHVLHNKYRKSRRKN